MAIRRAFFSPYFALRGSIRALGSAYFALRGSIRLRRAPGGAFVLGLRYAYPRRHRALSNAEPPYSIAITPTISYNDIRDQWHARRATMTEEANYGQISQSR